LHNRDLLADAEIGSHAALGTVGHIKANHDADPANQPDQESKRQPLKKQAAALVRIPFEPLKKTQGQNPVAL